MTTTLYDQLERRILLLDGGFGTMVQGYGLDEAAYRGERFRDWERQLRGCNDLLAVTRPGAVREIHVKYLQAGADIIETDSFNANAVSLADYRMEGLAYEISKAAAETARRAADEFTARNPQKPRFVAGSVGPTNRTASMSADVQNPAAREVTFAQLVAAYTDQVRGLVPWPSASMVLAGKPVKIHRTAVGEATDAPAGSVVTADKTGLSIACGDGKCLRILELQGEGGKRMAAPEYFLGHPLER